MIVYYPTILQAASYFLYISTFGKCPHSATITFTPIVVVIIRIFHLNWIIMFQVISDYSSKVHEIKHRKYLFVPKFLTFATWHHLYVYSHDVIPVRVSLYVYVKFYVHIHKLNHYNECKFELKAIHAAWTVSFHIAWCQSLRA